MTKLARLAAAVLVAAAAGFAGIGVAEGEYVDDWGPAIGSDLPNLSVQDTEGNVRALEDLAGADGTLLFVVRTSNW